MYLLVYTHLNVPKYVVDHMSHVLSIHIIAAKKK
jgi:hypothetical protein